LSRIDLTGHPKGSRQPFEDSFGDVVGVATVMQQDMEVAGCLMREGCPEMLDQLRIKRPDFR
jgi:hypothetical protein